MALFGRKNKGKEEQDKKSEKENVLDMVKDDKEQDKKDDAKDSSEKVGKAPKPSKENTGNAYKVLTRLIVSEKSYKLAGLSKYIFRVNPSANKLEIRKAVEKVYDVKVMRINIIRTPGKRKTSGRISGRTSDFKKAIVTLKAGQQIS